MFLRVPLALTVLALSLPFAHAQSCSDLFRSAALHQSGGVVSAAELRIPPKAWKHFEKARIASTQGNVEVFDRESAAALAVAPQFGQIYLLRAGRELRAGRPEAALAVIATARETQPAVPMLSVIAAGALNQLHRFRDAVAELDRASREVADSWQGEYERARAETGLRDVEAALHWSEVAVEAAPVGCTDVRLIRANALALAGRQTEVVAELESYLALDRQGTRRAQVLVALEKARTMERDPGLLAMK